VNRTDLVPVYQPPLPADEPQRVAALERYAILDTPPEEAFEEIADALMALFDVPIALVTFLDQSRQWFKSKRGVSADTIERRFSFCSTTILSREGHLVPSMLDDPRYRWNPYVTSSPFFRAYAGVPLMSPGGHSIGTLAVGDHKPRPDFDECQLARLHRLANLVVDELELRLAQSKLRLEKRKLEFALENAGMGLWSWDLDTDQLELPPTLGRLFGSDLPHAKEATLEGLVALVRGQDKARVRSELEDLRDTHQALTSVFRLDCVDCTRWIEVHADVDPDSDSRIIGTVRDITEREQLRAKMIRLDRLRAMSTLGAGLAHEINNPLSVVTTNLYLLDRWLDQEGVSFGDKQQDYVNMLLRQSRRGTDRIGSIVDDLLKMSRSGDTEFQATDVAEVLESVMSLMHTELPDNCELIVECEDVPRVRGRESLMGQVFVNLVLNAVAAVKAAGPTEHDKHVISVRCRQRTASSVEVEVGDSGEGISPRELSRVFDPFYTTKGPGEGTGLGLAISQSIVQAMGGDISIESELGEGTTVRVTFPIFRRRPHEPPGARPTL
jgi:two-component system, NtrC family, sensor kinase